MSIKNIKHLVIDEMQDYSYLQYLILKELFDCKMTNTRRSCPDFGQKNEQDDFKIPSYKVFGKNIRTVILNKSYRNTREIADYAGKIANVKDIEIFWTDMGKMWQKENSKLTRKCLRLSEQNLKLEKEGKN